MISFHLLAILVAVVLLQDSVEAKIYPVVLVKENGRRYQIPNKQAAVKECAKRGLTLASHGQLLAAFRAGMDSCSCGWLTNGGAYYPIRKPRRGCGTSKAGIRSCGRKPWRGHKGFNAYCSTTCPSNKRYYKAKCISNSIKAKTFPVVLVRENGSRYKIPNKQAAVKECAKRGLSLASYNQLYEAYGAGLDSCSCGWVTNGGAYYPITKPRRGCGSSPAGIRSCGTKPWKGNKGFNAYCSTKCHSTKRYYKAKCIPKCKDDEKWQEKSNKCVARCQTPYVWNAATQKCKSQCKAGEKWFTPTKTCYKDQVYSTSGGNGDGANCVIPFKYNGNWQMGCVQGQNEWCATTADYDKDKKWGYCVATCLTNSNKRVKKGDAWTSGGIVYICGKDGKGKKSNCVFPFSYKGVEYKNKCAPGNTPWCYTDKDQKNWEYC